MFTLYFPSLVETREKILVTYTPLPKKAGYTGYLRVEKEIRVLYFGWPVDFPRELLGEAMLSQLSTTDRLQDFCREISAKCPWASEFFEECTAKAQKNPEQEFGRCHEKNFAWPSNNVLVSQKSPV